VADGGSGDGTPELARRHGARVTASARGRGAQMNAGAAAATGDLLLFLHADSQLSSESQLAESLQALRGALTKRGPRVAGHFALRFARSTAQAAGLYRYLEAKSALGRPETINGDQGLMLTREYLRELGGFDERLPFLEDQRIAARIFATGSWILLPGRLLTSARRFETEGPLRRYTLMALIMAMHAAGAEDFFARAPGVYATHDRGGRLRLGPYLGALRRTLVAAGPRGALRILYRGGRYANRNAWQMFFARDVRREREPPYPALEFYDRRLAPLMHNAVFDSVATLLAAVTFLLVLPLLAAVTERAQPGLRST
jgi:glycosyltransferase involved in cell wall biosynthesis